jgi:NAD(P)-dependent dehydrogenase (short-subunit alcohol dehydrogenase family)
MFCRATKIGPRRRPCEVGSSPYRSLIVPTENAERELEQRVSQSIPLGRFSEADEVARAALYLASDDSASVSGTEIVVDGGATGTPLGAPIYRSA